MSREQLEHLVRFFRLLADPTRLRIVGLLGQGEHGVEELAAILALKPPTISHHLSRLSAEGLVSVRPEGNRRWYRLDEAALRKLAKRLMKPDTLTSAAGDVSERTYAERVLGHFLVDGRLTTIPAQRKKRNIVLEYLAGLFERGREYSEKQVSERIAEVHEDFATLRRELIMSRLMKREDGRYRRTERDVCYEP